MEDSVVGRGLISRRTALRLGGGIAGAFIAAGARAADGSGGSNTPSSNDFDEVEQIIQAPGKMEHGLFSINVVRHDITGVTVRDVPIKPAFQLHGELYFQALGNGRAVMNGDVALKPEELNPFIDQLVSNNLVLQAEHQHLYNFSPMVWFIHFRGVGDMKQMARGIKSALSVTSAPFPQHKPSNPSTPLPADDLGKILGASPKVGGDGVVSFEVPRKETITLGGVQVSAPE